MKYTVSINNSVSVCLASYNGDNFLRAQIDSVLNQLCVGDELIVSDDGSSDETVAILRTYGDRIRIVNIKRVGGVVKNFELALNSARGDFIVLCDQDDVWLDGKIELLREQLPHASLLMMNALVTDGSLVPTGQNLYEYVGFRPGFIRNFISNSYVGCCIAFRREILEVVLPFPRNILWHDWYIALVAELMFHVSHVDTPTLLFRRHGNNASTTGRKSDRFFIEKVVVRLWMLRAVAVAQARWIRVKLVASF